MGVEPIPVCLQGRLATSVHASPLGHGLDKPAACPANTPGRTRTCDRLLVRELPLPLGHGSEESIGPAGVEPAKNRVSDGRLAAWPRPEVEAPCTGLEPVSPVRQTGRHTRCVTGRFLKCRIEKSECRRQEQGRKDSNPLRQGWSLTALPGARPYQKVPAAGVEPAAFSVSRRRSYRLSYTGMSEECRI